MKSLRMSGVISAWALIGLAFLPGCGSSTTNPPGVDAPLVHQNLRVIRLAMNQACQQLERGPANEKELQPFLDLLKASPDVLRSPRDGLDFAIVWGVDIRKPDPAGQDVVVVYEKAGRSDGRYVLKLRGVEFLPHADFQKAKFPQGHSPQP